MEFHVPNFIFSVEEAARKEAERRNAEAFDKTVGAAVKEAQERPIGEQITLKEYVRNAFVGQAQALALPQYEQQKREISDQHYTEKKAFYDAKYSYEDAAGRRQGEQKVAETCAKMTEMQLKYAPESVSAERRKAHERYQAAETDQQRLAAGRQMHVAIGEERKQEWNHHLAVNNFQRQEAQMAGMQDKALGMANRAISEESRSRPGQKGEDPQVNQASKSALDAWKEKLVADRAVEKAYKEAKISNPRDIEQAPVERQVDLMRTAHERFEKTSKFVDQAKTVQTEKERAQSTPGIVAQDLEPAQKNAAIREQAFKPEGSQTWHEKGTRLPLMRENANGVQLIGEAGKRRECVSTALDVLQDRGAKTVNLKGSDEFRKEAWLQASQRGMVAKGYSPTPEDKNELVKRQKQAQTQTSAATPQASPERTERQQMIEAARQARGENNQAREYLKNQQTQTQKQAQNM